VDPVIHPPDNSAGMDVVYAAGALGLIGLLLWAATRQNEVFRVKIERGRVTVLRGKVPPGFLGDLREIAPHVKEGGVHAVKRGGEAALVVSSSIDERTAQRLRNAFAVHRGGSSSGARSRL
jgi:hypothetical protein